MKITSTLVVLVFSLLELQVAMSNDLPIKLKTSLSEKEKIALNYALAEVTNILPVKVIANLPKDIELKFKNLTEHNNIPSDICNSGAPMKGAQAFVYGEYNKSKNELVLNRAVLNELIIGPTDSKRINCQHKSLYEQAISTIVHELTHAYDFQNNISNSQEFVRRAGFKKGLLITKSKNNDPMRSADNYELVNIAEAYAVNMEYFTMDSEFACRKPALFDYYKRSLEMDPYPNRQCAVNNTVMMSTSSGFYPIKLDTSRVYRIDYLMAAPGKELSSGFGHSMFRIIICAPERLDPISNRIIPATPYGKKCLEDKLFHLVVSYRANVEDATLNYVKGLFGGYPSMLFILNFADVLDEYNGDELRDVVSYPLKLSSKDKSDFINKVLEEHWNYRGAYRFITNNCAVESFDLLKSSLDRSEEKNLHSLSPKGVLEDLDKLEFLTIKNGSEELFKARTEQLLLALKMAYSHNLANAKKDKKALLKFIDESTISERLRSFREFAAIVELPNDMHAEISLLKDRLIKASSFSVMEQQILRSKSAQFRKKAADLFINTKDEKIKKILAESSEAQKLDFKGLSSNGYGVPLVSEMLTKENIDQRAALSKEMLETLDVTLRELMGVEFKTLKEINANILIFNSKSLAIRKNYRERLEIYTKQVLKNLTLDDLNRTILINALNDAQSLSKVRDLLDRNLVTEKEILNDKLVKLIQETIEN